MYRILVTGSREWTNTSIMFNAIQLYTLGRDVNNVAVVSGGATGADTIAVDVANALGVISEVHPADWETHGKKAGMIRNRKMVDLGADVVLGFIMNNSRGATHCFEYAESQGIRCRRWDLYS